MRAGRRLSCISPIKGYQSLAGKVKGKGQLSGQFSFVFIVKISDDADWKPRSGCLICCLSTSRIVADDTDYTDFKSDSVRSCAIHCVSF